MIRLCNNEWSAQKYNTLRWCRGFTNRRSFGWFSLLSFFFLDLLEHKSLIWPTWEGENASAIQREYDHRRSTHTPTHRQVKESVIHAISDWHDHLIRPILILCSRASCRPNRRLVPHFVFFLLSRVKTVVSTFIGRVMLEWNVHVDLILFVYYDNHWRIHGRNSLLNLNLFRSLCDCK